MQPSQDNDRAGEAAEFATAFNQCAPLVLRFAWRRLGDEGAAWDVVSDTFTSAWRNWNRRPAPETLLPWLYAIAGHAIKDQARAARRRQRLAAKLTSATQGAQVPDPADEVVLTQSIVMAMARLSQADSEVLRLVGWEHLDDAQALGLVLGVPPGTARVRVHRARQRLRAVLAEQAGPGPRRDQEPERQRMGSAGAAPSATPDRPDRTGCQELMTSAVVRARAREA